MIGKFAGKHALVTGATQGLGAEIARALQREGASVILSGIDDLRGEHVLRELPNCEYWHLNVAEEADWARAAGKLRARGIALDVLVNNAAIVRYEAIAACTTASFQDVMNVNLVGPFLAIRELYSLMPHGASIINISSCAGLEGVNGACSYVASKWALTGLTKAAALELGHRGIRVNSVHPRAMATEMIADKVAENAADTIFSRQAIPRIAATTEVAKLVLFLASADSSYCTGAAYLVDGGYMAGEVMATMTVS
jgi:3alpha(or 20beta)-hydroxysteroid dehydrogenase